MSRRGCYGQVAVPVRYYLLGNGNGAVVGADAGAGGGGSAAVIMIGLAAVLGYVVFDEIRASR